jgi:hypothetical protein
MRRNGKSDGNQSGIVDDLRRIPGCTVAVTSSAGDGFPDLVVGFRGFNFLVEIKDPEQPKHRHELTDDQKLFHAAWKGQVAKCFTFMDVVRLLTAESSPSFRHNEDAA